MPAPRLRRAGDHRFDRTPAEARGTGFGFAIEPRDARKIRVDTFTEDAREPAATIHRR
ncbi:hypothetical protein SBADM41S_07431 [Streptomyces badius]